MEKTQPRFDAWEAEKGFSVPETMGQRYQRMGGIAARWRSMGLTYAELVEITEASPDQIAAEAASGSVSATARKRAARMRRLEATQDEMIYFYHAS